MSTLKLIDGTTLYYKDWGEGQPIVFHHGYTRSPCEWNTEMLFFSRHGYRAIACDRRLYFHSGQIFMENEIETYAADIAKLTEALDIRNAIHVGYSTNGVDVLRYVNKYGKDRVAKVILIKAKSPHSIQHNGIDVGKESNLLDKISLLIAS